MASLEAMPLVMEALPAREEESAIKFGPPFHILRLDEKCGKMAHCYRLNDLSLEQRTVSSQTGISVYCI